MATFSYRDVVTRTREYTVPAAQPWGACLGDLRSAMNAASLAYREAHGTPEAVSLTDDALRFFPRDDEIVISFTVEEPTQ